MAPVDAGIDVVVAGAGPAGWAVARACAERGLRTVLVAPRPAAAWPATYGMWLDEAALLPAGAGYVVARARVVAGGSRWLDREYAVLDNASVRAALAHPEVRVLAGRLTDGVVELTGGGIEPTHGTTEQTAGTAEPTGGTAEPARGRIEPTHGRAEPTHGQTKPTHRTTDPTGQTDPTGRRIDPTRGGTDPTTRGMEPTGGIVEPTGGGTVAAPVVIDATGARAHGGVEQTAFGLRVPAEVAVPLVGPGEAVFMDWRQPRPGPPTFLYAVPLPDGRVLLEETSLARRPGLPFAELRERLLTRLATHGIDPGDADQERVRIPLDLAPPPAKTPTSRAHACCPAPTRSRGAPLMPVYRRGGAGAGVAAGVWTTFGSEWQVVPFGAAAGLVHPATGFGVADALRLAPLVADAIATGGASAARRVVWSARARAVHRLRRAGLRALLALGPERTEGFFELFFGLPAHRQRAFLSGREDLPGTAAAMAGLFLAAPWELRRVLAFRR